MSTARTVGARNPLSARMSRTKLFNSIPARISRAALRPTSDATRTLRSRIAPDEAVAPRVAERSVSCGSLRLARQAGRNPNRRAAAATSIAANPNTRPSSATSSSRGMPAGAYAFSKSIPMAATPVASRPPPKASSRDSANP